MQTIAVVQARGGAGKSTVSAHLACGLADAGLSTMLVDLVPGGGSSRYLGVQSHRGGADLWDVLEGRSEILAASIPLTDHTNLRVVPAVPRLTGYEFEMRGPFRLRVALAPLKRQKFDCVILDTGPSSSLSTRKALAAAQYVLLVVETKAPGMYDLGRQMEVIEQTREQLNPGLEILGIVPSRVARTRLARATIGALHAEYPELMLPSIRESTGVAEVPLHGVPVTRSAPLSNGARDFDTLNRAVLLRLGRPVQTVGSVGIEAPLPSWRKRGTGGGKRPGWPLPENRPVPKTRRLAR